jgi:hypothetical protein
MNRWLALIVVSVAVAACDRPPTAPTTRVPDTPPTVLTITPATSLLEIGASETFSTFAVFPDGSGQTVAAQWSLDQPAVATIQSTGVVTAVGSGTVTITASAHGRTASRSLRVVPEYAGSWEATVTVIECLDGDPGVCSSAPCPTLGVCPPLYPPGRTMQIAAILAHRDEHVTGFVTSARGLVLPSSGMIDLDGTLKLAGALQRSDSIGSYETRMDWTTTLDSNGGLHGSYVEVQPAFSNNRMTPPARIRSQIVSGRRTPGK